MSKINKLKDVIFAQKDFFDNTLFNKRGVVMDNFPMTPQKLWVLFEDIGLRQVPITSLEPHQYGSDKRIEEQAKT